MFRILKIQTITAKERSFFLHPLIQKPFFFRKLNSGFLRVVPGVRKLEEIGGKNSGF
ncbi:hypothetical protein LEP1GSC034_0082 [Leptospira interrogans str. 2003000735]|nr:hypothetical protein LEP1GSC027_2926 [Leptospira interrogans str. 2002000624]EKQ37659.1 hypothetical protein LEP1GSC025_0988 [Leptospira interrogans str. 2002000621]EKQ46356.1 hypothetical protein LEP1GSC026_0489 [Leptospira interrogans str. 2002000623]EMJ67214.1 hypothetical protein LEP1GSC034_0082 [Leptospira interrogans str. 2003000735]EMJ84117.1 hypothetical protein LEP1GSC032_0373 [Leptospira interrogans str. 2002000631]